MSSALRTVVPEPGLSAYLRQIQRYPMLPAEEELSLARLWRDRQDVSAARKLVTSHLRLVVRIAVSYRGYGLPLGDLIGVGSVGLMQAVRGYDPERGFRFATYAMWWIRAAIQEHVLHAGSLVKIGTTATQKKLFFNLRRMKAQMHVLDGVELQPQQVARIASALDVPEHEVIDMDHRLASGDRSLNAPLAAEGEGEWQDWLADESDSQETTLADREELSSRMELLPAALKTLNERELHILRERRLKDHPTTLEDLSLQYGVSRERVRQIEVRAFEKVRNSVRAQLTRRQQEIAARRGGGEDQSWEKSPDLPPAL